MSRWVSRARLRNRSSMVWTGMYTSMFASRIPSRCAVSLLTRRSASTPTTESQGSPTLLAAPDPGPLRGLVAPPPVGQHSHHREPGFPHLDRPADRVLGGEEAAPHPVADDGHREPALHLEGGEPG